MSREIMQRLAGTWEELGSRPEGFICDQAAQASKDAIGEGELWGYWSTDNPTAALGSSEGGHTFLIVENKYILDFWAAAYYGHKPIFDLIEDAEEILVLFGPRECWTAVESCWPRKERL